LQGWREKRGKLKMKLRGKERKSGGKNDSEMRLSQERGGRGNNNREISKIL
jgi:hypothetical protein